jgi:hypothetical protein
VHPHGVSRPRLIRVYRLEITYPPGALEPGWEPPGWDLDIDGYGGPDDDYSFHWPQNRLCLSPSTAQRRARLFRSFGAEVTIVPSGPVTWPEAAA